jgi:hypothetical protein
MFVILKSVQFKTALNVKVGILANAFSAKQGTLCMVDFAFINVEMDY